MVLKSKLRRFAGTACGTALLIFGCIVCSASAAFGQGKQVAAPAARPGSTTGTISGEVDDKSGAPLAGVEVKWTGEGATQPSIVTTDALGTFNISRLEAGKYQLTFTSKGCVPKNEKVNVRAGHTTKVHVHLKPPPAPKQNNM